ncbi:hypothetical protein K474DRAFT_1708410 [Panus rudis PR-1116 ss-1]|nr:hypothetical protein K474DRAFT_1708410 [Panus rudis PR-1116 ss-1]
MFRREREAHDESDKSLLAYRRTSIPSIAAISSASSSPASSRRAPLAPLHTGSPNRPLDDQMSSLYARPDLDAQDMPHYLPRSLVANRPYTEEQTSIPPRKRSIPGHNSTRSPYSSSRSSQRRPSNTSSTSSGRRSSLPSVHSFPAQSHLVPENVHYPLPPTSEDIYSGLSTFTFGAVQPPPAAQDSDLISPLTRLNTADRTPRPSISKASSSRSRNGKQKAKDHDPDMGDDEYEDEDDAARQKSRSKMRAIDDGSRRPSLPTNVYIPENSSSPMSPQTREQISPAVGSERDSAPDDSEPDGDDGDLDTDVEFDLHGHTPPVPTDGLLPNSQTRLKSGNRDGRGSSGDRSDHRRRRRSLDRDRKSEREKRGDGQGDGNGNESDSREVSVSPVTFSRHDYDSEGPEVDTFYVAPDGDQQQQQLPPSSQSSRLARRGSVPWDIPGAVSRQSAPGALPRDREDSMATITSRSANVGGHHPSGISPLEPFASASSQPQTKSDFRNLEEAHLQQHAQQDQQMVEGPQRLEDQSDQPQQQNDVYDGFNMDYILSGPTGSNSSVRRSSWAPSYIQQTNRGDVASPFWMSGTTGPDGRRPSTMTVGTSSGEDIFTKHLRLYDEGYDERRTAWSFKMDGTDVRSPTRATHANVNGAHAPEKIDPRKPMEPNTREIWRQAYVGMFKVDRQRVESDKPDKAPQQRINIRHVADPYCKGNTRGGPNSVIHKHSRAAAFSIFRAYSLFSGQAKQRRPAMQPSISILLATKKVQEQYTSTRTTSKLNSHGLLEDRHHGHQQQHSQQQQQYRNVGQSSVTSSISTAASSSATTTVDSSRNQARSKSRRRGDEDGDNSATTSGRGTSSQTNSGWSAHSNDSMATSPSPGPSSPRSPVSKHSPFNHHAHGSPAPEKMVLAEESSLGRRRSESPMISGSVSPISAKHPSPPPPPAASSSTAVVASSSRLSNLRTDPMDLDDDEISSPPRTSHAEAFATIDSTYLEYLRGRTEHRHQQDDFLPSHGLVGALRRRLLGQGSSKVGVRTPAAGPGVAPLEGHYTPPWLTMAPRSKQEERERVIQNLNESFKDVGLLPSLKPPKMNAGSSAKGKRRKNASTPSVFANVPADSLYMLLPLWPGETDPASAELSEDRAGYIVQLEDRQYLLVYYVPFQEDSKKKRDKKRSRGQGESSSHSHSHSNAGPGSGSSSALSISLTSFRVCARLVSYADLRDTGVRLPDYGLSVTGSMTEATQYLPPREIRDKNLDDVIIGLCNSRRAGMEFYSEGLATLGLCMPQDAPVPLPVREEDPIVEVDVKLTPIGRAAVEMAWLGCMALTCF